MFFWKPDIPPSAAHRQCPSTWRHFSAKTFENYNHHYLHIITFHIFLYRPWRDIMIAHRPFPAGRRMTKSVIGLVDGTIRLISTAASSKFRARTPAFPHEIIIPVQMLRFPFTYWGLNNEFSTFHLVAQYHWEHGGFRSRILHNFSKLKRFLERGSTAAGSIATARGRHTPSSASGTLLAVCRILSALRQRQCNFDSSLLFQRNHDG